jgi:hypothetical protein
MTKHWVCGRADENPILNKFTEIITIAAGTYFLFGVINYLIFSSHNANALHRAVPFITVLMRTRTAERVETGEFQKYNKNIPIKLKLSIIYYIRILCIIDSYRR